MEDNNRCAACIDLGIDCGGLCKFPNLFPSPANADDVENFAQLRRRYQVLHIANQLSMIHNKEDKKLYIEMLFKEMEFNKVNMIEGAGGRVLALEEKCAQLEHANGDLKKKMTKLVNSLESKRKNLRSGNVE